MISTTAIYEQVNARILAALDHGVPPWRKPWKMYRSSNAVSGKPYRGINTLLLPQELYSDHRWMTFNQAKDLGGSVRKGETSSIIVFWTKSSRTKAQDDSGETITTVKEYNTPILKMYRVFNVGQVDGLSLPVVLHDNSEIIDAERIIRSMPNSPEHCTAGRAAYSPRRDIVFMPNRELFITSDEYYSTFFHELAHATGHPTRLARFETSCPLATFGSDDYGREELVAEFAAAFLCAAAGIATSTLSNSAAYIAGWQRAIRDDPRLLMAAASKAQKAADYILGGNAIDAI